MKRTFVLIFLLIFALNFGFSLRGSGTISDPFIVTTCEELKDISLDLDANYALGNNIDCNGISDPDFANNLTPYFVPIGNYFTQKDCDSTDSGCITSQWHYDQNFLGSFDGRGFTIKNLSIVINSSDTAALFLHTSKSSVLKDFTIENSFVSGYIRTGTIVGTNYGTISNVHVKKGQVTGTNAGGLVGYNYGTINSDSFEGEFYGDGWYVGGLVGTNYNLIKESYFKGKMTGGFTVGGLVGVNYRKQGEYEGKILNSYFDGNLILNSISGSYAGGISGRNYGVISNTFAKGDINSEGSETGGITGATAGTIEYAYFEGNIFGKDLVGGIAGIMDYNSVLDGDKNKHIKYSFAKANIISSGDGTGGIVGQLGGNPDDSMMKYSIQDCFFTGTIKASRWFSGGIAGAVFNKAGNIYRTYFNGRIDGTEDCGGIVGLGYGLISDSYSNAKIFGTERVGGIAGSIQSAGIINVYALGEVSGNSFVGGLAGECVAQTPLKNSYSLSKISASSRYGALIGYSNTSSDPPGVEYRNIYWDPLMSKLSRCYDYVWGDSNSYCTSVSGEANYTGSGGIPFSSLNWSTSIWNPIDSNHPLLGSFCTGNTFENASMYSNDEVNLLSTDNLINVLSSSNTSRTCEWHCNSGYAIGSGAYANTCVTSDAVCTGTVPSNSTICPDDGIGLTSSVAISLVNSCTASKKCEYYCSTDYKLYNLASGSACIPSDWEIGACGEAAKFFDIDMPFPGDNNYCTVGTAQPAILELGNNEGDTVAWTCVTDINKACTATRVDSNVNETNACSILDLNATFTQSEGLIINAKCSCSTKMDLSFMDYSSGDKVGLSNSSFYCNGAGFSNSIGFATPLTEEMLLKATADIEPYTECNACKFETYVNYVLYDTSEKSIPDNSAFCIVLVVLVSLVILQKKRI